MKKKDENSQHKYILTYNELSDLCGIGIMTLDGFFEQEDCISIPGGKTGIPPYLVKMFLKENGVNYSCQVLSYINMRGGIGKTTATITTATRAKQYGFKTCIIDIDPQGSATLACNMVPEPDDPIFYDIWQKPEEMVMGTIKKIDEDLYILPSSLENGLLDSSLINPSAQKNAVKGVCDILKDNGFELIIIDNPPSLGTAVISSVCASNTIVVPMFSDVFSFRGLDITLSEIHSICDTFNMVKPNILALFSRYDGREKASEKALLKLKSQYPDHSIPFYIRTSTEFSKALERKETIFASFRKSNAKDDYDLYVRHILDIDKVFLRKEENIGQKKQNGQEDCNSKRKD